ncbi:hypothetical protein AVJ23_06765 [Pseudoponticoccus marisrubri]|uniref:Yip1 domain-containing protein n=1 Tax=Pseudoponticoccus marisrubri TaxID=1685382 RepID=A0A0W7WLN5_9RHOB|nr:hypothetical protein AVJ23_06765 [Pseudoponticoccus marisrubri]
MQGVLSLAVQTVVAPRDVARLLLSIRPGREALATAFALVVVLNALVFQGSRLLMPGPVPPLLGNPVSFLVLQGGTLALTALALTWTARLFDGRGRFEEVALLLIWMQGLRVLVQAALMLILPLSAGLGTLALAVGTAVGVWILLNFLDEVHGLGSLFKAALVLMLGVIAMAFALSVLLALAGVTPNEMTTNV